MREGDILNTSIKKIGNSKGVIIPASILKVLGINENDSLDLKIENRQIILSKIEVYEPMILEELFVEYKGNYDVDLVFPDDIGEEKW